MRFVGWQKTSLIDYPKSISTVLFTSGCNWKCFYCHNYKLVTDNRNLIDENEIKKYILERSNKLDAVVVSGGEPTLQPDLIEFLVWLRKTGLKVKLDTNGWNFNALKNILDKKLVDYIAMDIKTSFDKYEKITKVLVDKNEIIRSINLIKNGEVDYEFRTTVFKEFVELDDLKEIGKLINGAEKYFLQNYVYRESIKNGNKIMNYTDDRLRKMVEVLKKEFNFGKIGIR